MSQPSNGFGAVVVTLLIPIAGLGLSWRGMELNWYGSEAQQATADVVYFTTKSNTTVPDANGRLTGTTCGCVWNRSSFPVKDIYIILEPMEGEMRCACHDGRVSFEDGKAHISMIPPNSWVTPTFTNVIEARKRGEQTKYVPGLLKVQSPHKSFAELKEYSRDFIRAPKSGDPPPLPGFQIERVPSPVGPSDKDGLTSWVGSGLKG